MERTRDAYKELHSNYYELYDLTTDFASHIERKQKGETRHQTVGNFRDRVETTKESAEEKMRRRGILPRRNRSLTERSNSTRKSDAIPCDPTISSSSRIVTQHPSPEEPVRCLLELITINKLGIQLRNAPVARQTALLLQAIRQQLTVSSNREYGRKAIRILAQGDILLLRSRRNSLVAAVLLLNDGGAEVKEQLARMLNAMASYTDGREYLLSVGQGKDLLAQLMAVLRSRKLHSFTLDNLIATVEKLSIRGVVQKELLQQGVLDWLLPTFSTRLSPYALEYATALLMNLCMHNAPSTLLRYLDELLNVLTSLLLVQNPAICPFINGSFYGLFAMSRARSRAKDLVIEGCLQAKLDLNDCTSDEFQLPFLIRQLRGDVDMLRIPLPPTEEEDSVGDRLECEVDATDQLRPLATELSGARLLMQRINDGSKEEGINVPGTVPQRIPVSSRTTKKEIGRRGKVRFASSQSEPRISTTASQATFVVETERRKPFVVVVGLTEAALQWRNTVKQRENEGKVLREKETKNHETIVNVRDGEKHSDKENVKRTTADSEDDEKKLKKRDKEKDASFKETERKEQRKREELKKEETIKECKRLAKDMTKIPRPPDPRHRKSHSEDSQSLSKVGHSEEQKVEKHKETPLRDSKQMARTHIEENKDTILPQDDTLPLESLGSLAAPVSSKVPQRIPDDANAYDYIAVFGARPKLLRTPDKEKKGPKNAILY